MIPGPARVLPEGGEAHLEADVMRFVAILALCLVAISTLVSAPPPAPAAAPASRAMSQEPASPDPSPTPTTPGGGDAVLRPPDPLTDPPSGLAPGQPPAPPARAAAVPPAPVISPAEPNAAAPPEPAGAAPGPAPPPPRPAPGPRGFVLRFDSDAALLRLAAAGRVGVYALRGDGALRLRLGAAGAEMVPGPTPASFHVMDPATVPGVLRRALPEGAAGTPPTWAVTLPEDSRAQLAGLMRGYEDGELVIAVDGGVRRLAHED